MKIKSLLVAIVAFAAALTPLQARPQTDASTGATVSSETSYIANDFDGFRFQLPAGVTIEKGSQFKALYPDGTFGVSMFKVNTAANRKISVELCKRAADSMHISRNAVKKVTYGKIKGAEAKGIIEGKEVTIIVLPYDEHQLQIVLMANPSRESWTRHFVESLRR